jgi:protein-tyrosine phosphatase
VTLPDIPAAGLLDLHCHVLPGIDDGCRHLGESLQVVERWIELGLVGAVCTPHVCTTIFPNNHPQQIAACVADLQRAIDAADLRFDLWPGGEVRLGPNTIAWFGEYGVPTIGPGRAVLIDWWGRDWPACCEETIEWLFERDYQPVLAHPERMGLVEDELEMVIDRLQARGVWLQGNLNSLGGGEGSTAQRRADRWLAEDRYHLLASDTHGPDSVAGRAVGLARVREQCGEETIARLLVARPREVMRYAK